MPKDQIDFGPPSHKAFLLRWYIANHLTAQTGLLAVIITIVCSKKLKSNRNPTVYNFLIVWWLQSFCACLLFMAGRPGITNDDLPSYGLCLFQGSVMYAFLAASMLSIAALIVELFFHFQVVTLGIPSKRTQIRRQIVLIILCWVPFFIIFFYALGNGIRYPEDVSNYRQFLRCSTPGHYIGLLTAIFFGVGIVTALLSLCKIIRLLILHWATIKALRARGDISRHFLLRVINFSHFVLICLALAGYYLSAIWDHGASLNVILSFQPLWAFITFASQPDIYHQWMFWRKSDDRQVGTRKRTGTLVSLDDLETMSFPDLTQVPSSSDHTYSRPIRPLV